MLGFSANFFISTMSVVVVVIIIIIRHQLGPNSPASPSSNSLFKGLPSCLRPLGLQFNIIFGVPLLFILVTFRSRFDLYLPSFSSTGSTFIASKISSLILCSCVPGSSEKLVTLTAHCAALGKYIQNGCSVTAAVRAHFFITWFKLFGLFSVYFL